MGGRMRFDGATTLVLAWNKKIGRFEDKTPDIVSLEFDGRQYAIRYRNTRFPFKYNAENISLCAPYASQDIGDALIEVRGTPWPSATRLDFFATAAGTWTRVHYPTQAGPAFRSYPGSEVRLAANARQQPRLEQLMRYFESVVAAHPADDPLHGAFGRLRYIHPDSALAAYLAGTPIQADAASRALTFPFSSNMSQRDALASALGHQISVIEGPPGTGKTQTILNLIANIVQDPHATVGVVSFSNAAVDNVYDKLTKAGFGFIAAPLGNRDRKAAFLDGQAARNAELADFLTSPQGQMRRGLELAHMSASVDWVYNLERQAATLRTMLTQVERESADFVERFPGDDLEATGALPGASHTWTSARLLELLAELELARFATSGLARLRWKLRRRVRYRLRASVDTADAAFTVAIQRRYYEARRAEIAHRLAEYEAQLASSTAVNVRASMQAVSLEVLEGAVHARYQDKPAKTHTADSLWRERDAFARDYPVLLSTCHSLASTVGPGRLLDYVIIDEASQVNLAVAILAMSVARRVIVVGDVHQLPHIPQDVGGLGLNEELAPYDYSSHSIISSLLALHGDALPKTMLREHYRCDPRIIEFCNRMYYGGQLIAMSKEGDGPALALVRTSPGQHSRAHVDGGHTNQRELDVIQEAIPRLCADMRPEDVGVVTPFRRQADLVAAALPGVEADTVHKFQGREKPVMVLSTLIDATHSGTRLASFVDDARMINVAVSRAQSRLVVVANPDLPEECTNLRQLVDYIEQREPGHVLRSDIVSVFDVLYTEYADVLRGLASRLRSRTPYRSEEAALVMLEGLLATEEFQHLRVNYQVLLRHLVPTGAVLSPDEATFVGHGSSVDFVISDRITERALGVIEVDGFMYHQDNPAQLRRDALKDAILARSGIALLRLPTTGSGEVERTAGFLRGLAAVPS